MLCDKCKKNEARIYYTEIVNGHKTEQHLCEECATEYTSFHMGTSIMNQEVTLGSLLSTILGNYGSAPSQKKETELYCSSCGMTYSRFLKTGRFGCGQCYESFKTILDKSFKTIQGATTHTGKKPKGYVTKTEKIIKGLSEIDKLSIQLQDAIEKEEFEEAARLRDLIRALKREEANNA